MTAWELKIHSLKVEASLAPHRSIMQMVLLREISWMENARS